MDLTNNQLSADEGNQKVRLLDILTRRNSNSTSTLKQTLASDDLFMTTPQQTHITGSSTARASAPQELVPHLPQAIVPQTSDLNTRRPSLSTLLSFSFERRKSQAGMDLSEEHVDQPAAVMASLSTSRRLKGVPTLEEIGGRIRVKREKLNEVSLRSQEIGGMTKVTESNTGIDEEIGGEKKNLPLPEPTRFLLEKPSDSPVSLSTPDKSISTPSKAILHPLSYSYSFYFRPLTTLPKATRRKPTTNKNIKLIKGLEEYTEIKTGIKDLETFCPYFNRAKRPSQLAMSGLIMGVGEGGESVGIVRVSSTSRFDLEPEDDE